MRGWRMQSQTNMEAQRTFLSTAGLTRFSEVFFFLAPPGLNGSTRHLRSLLPHAGSLSIFFFFQLRHRDLFYCSMQDLVS